MTTRDGPHLRLKAWHACHELTQAVFRISVDWPREHQEVLGDEARGSARMATQALELGAMLRDPTALHDQTVEACGKLGRLGYTLKLARDVNLVTRKDYGELEALRDHADRLIWGLRTHLRRKLEKKSAGEPARKRKNVRE